MTQKTQYKDYVPPLPSITGMEESKFREYRHKMERRLSNPLRSIVRLERKGVLPANYLTDWQLAMQTRSSERLERQSQIARAMTNRPSLDHLVNKGILRKQFVELDINAAQEALDAQNKELKHTLQRKLTTPVAVNDEEKSQSLTFFPVSN